MKEMKVGDRGSEIVELKGKVRRIFLLLSLRRDDRLILRQSTIFRGVRRCLSPPDKDRDFPWRALTSHLHNSPRSPTLQTSPNGPSGFLMIKEQKQIRKMALRYAFCSTYHEVLRLPFSFLLCICLLVHVCLCLPSVNSR